MQKLTTYWYALRQSVTAPDYYFTLRSVRLFFSVQFFLFSLFLIAVFEVPNWAFRILPVVLSDVRQESTHLLEQMSEDTVFTYTGEELKVDGLELPKTLTMSTKAQDLGYPKNLIEITNEETAGDAVITLTPKMILYSMPDTNGSEATYKDVFAEETGSISRDQIRTGIFSFLDMVQERRFELSAALAVFGFFSSIFTGLLTILFYSIFVQVVGWALGVRITYKFAVRWGLHIFPIALAIQELSNVLAPTVSFPILSVTYIAIATLILWVGRTDRPTLILNE